MSFKEEFERVQAAGAEANAEQARKRKQQAEAKRKQRAGGVSAAQQETETAAARSGDDAEIARLAALPPVTYDRERKEAAEALGVRVSLLDRMVSEARNGREREKRARLEWEKEDDTQIAEINATHALVLAGNKAAVMKFEDETKFRLLQVGAFKQWFSNQLIPVGKKIISLGDYNAFAFNDGYGDSMGTIKGLPAPADQVVLASPDLVNPNLTDLTDTLAADQRYSYNFDGNAQELDHVLINAAILPRFSRFAIARLDSDFPESFRNDSTRPERISDHDPAVAYFSLPIFTEVTGQVNVVQSGLAYNRGTRLFVGTITVTNTGTQTIASPIEVVLNGLTPGVTLANAAGSFGGNPYVTANTSLAPGQSVSLPVQYSNPGNVAITMTLKIYSGAF